MKKVVALIILGVFLSFGHALASLYSITPTDDAHVSTFTPTTNLNLTGLTTSYVTSPISAIVTAYLKFDLANIPSNEAITSATLYLYKYGGVGSSSGTTSYFVSNDSWSESSITASTAPSLGSAIGSNSTSGSQSNNAWLSWTLSLTPGLISDSVLSLALQESILSGTAQNSHYFYSSEYSSLYTPYLEVQTSAVPIPAAVWLLGTGLMGLVAIRRKSE